MFVGNHVTHSITAVVEPDGAQPLLGQQLVFE